jgi:hypothetical protein
MNASMKYILGLLVVGAVAASAYTFFATPPPQVVIDRPFSGSSSAPARISSSPAAAASSAPAQTPPPADNPGSVRLTMDFASQAPLGSWDPPYDEACEESSLVIVRHFLEQTPLDPTIMNQDILAMVDHEKSKGLPVDIDMLQLAQVARDMFGYDATVVEGGDVTIARIETELAKGNPVILPLAGQDIGNPYYSGDGPPYHVLVVVGYGGSNFVTHDVGTKRGEYYSYRKETLMSAIHDWNGSVDTIRTGPKRMLVVTK